MRKLLTFILAVALVFSFAMTANAAYKDMWAAVYSWDGTMTADGKLELTKITSGITYVVLQRNSMATMETLVYYDSDAGTSLTNPVTGTDFGSATIGNDMVRFRVDPSETNDTYVDLIVIDQAGGYTAFIEDFTEYKHTIIIDERPNEEHWGAAFIMTTATSTEIDTGIDFEKTSIIYEMKVHVCTAFASLARLNVGITGTNADADGFIHEEGLATAGWHSPYRAGVDLTGYLVSSGGNVPTYYTTDIGANDDTSVPGPSVGTFLGNFWIGTDAAASNVSRGGLNKENLVIHGTWGDGLVYTFASGANTAITANSTGWAMLWYRFTRIR